MKRAKKRRRFRPPAAPPRPSSAFLPPPPPPHFNALIKARDAKGEEEEEEEDASSFVVLWRGGWGGEEKSLQKVAEMVGLVVVERKVGKGFDAFILVRKNGRSNPFSLLFLHHLKRFSFPPSVTTLVTREGRRFRVTQAPTECNNTQHSAEEEEDGNSAS